MKQPLHGRGVPSPSHGILISALGSGLQVGQTQAYLYQRHLNPICKQGKGVSGETFFPSGKKILLV